MHNSQITAQLNDEGLNRELTYAFLEYAGQECELPGFPVPKPYRLVRSVYCNEYRIVSDEDYPQTLFYIKLFDLPHQYTSCLKSHPQLNQKLTQCLVWSSMVPNHRNTFHFLATKFFEYFLDQYNIAITAGSMTLVCGHFWEGRLLWAITRRDVDVLHLRNAEDLSTLSNVNTWLDFSLDWRDIIWNSSENIPDPSLVVISKVRPVDELNVLSHYSEC